MPVYFLTKLNGCQTFFYCINVKWANHVLSPKLLHYELVLKQMYPTFCAGHKPYDAALTANLNNVLIIFKADILLSSLMFPCFSTATICLLLNKIYETEKETSNVFTSIFWTFFFLFSGCEKDVQKVCSDSSEEHLQPFKDKMEAFVLRGE